MTRCVFPGSFDPVTKGHLNLIRRASHLFEHVTVTVMVNVAKKGSIAPEKRVELLKRVCSSMRNVSIDRWDGLLVDYMKQKKDSIVIRGVRNTTEYESEKLLAQANRMLYPELETILLFSDNDMDCVSSSAVREIAHFGGDITSFVPELVADEISHLLKEE